MQGSQPEREAIRMKNRHEKRCLPSASKRLRTRRFFSCSSEQRQIPDKLPSPDIEKTCPCASLYRESCWPHQSSFKAVLHLRDSNGFLAICGVWPGWHLLCCCPAASRCPRSCQDLQLLVICSLPRSAPLYHQRSVAARSSRLSGSV